MQYIETHPRKVRGESVHQTASERKANLLARKAAMGEIGPDRCFIHTIGKRMIQKLASNFPNSIPLRVTGSIMLEQ